MDGKANFSKINPTPKFALSTEPGRNRTFFSISIMLMCVPITPQVRIVLRQHLFSNMHSKIFKFRIHVTKYNDFFKSFFATTWPNLMFLGEKLKKKIDF